MEQSVSSYSLLPKGSGVYIFVGKNRKVLYVGKAKDLRDRVSSYFRNEKYLGIKTKRLVSQIRKIRYVEVTSEIESFLLEANLVKKYSPRYNTRLTDGKSYPYVRITKKDRFPKVLISRRTDDKNSIYFGPFPNVGDLYSVLRHIRRIFPYQNVLNHPKRICLYNHLGLCPCPPILQSIDAEKRYKRNIRHIIQFLNGEAKKVLKELEKERNQASKTEDFEEAQKIQLQIEM
ncbi:MAG: GIY-YIG nuclease family protein, partial [Patescibacteria group bacterium]